MGTGYSTLPTNDDNDMFVAAACKDLGTKHCTTQIFRKEPQIRPTLHRESINTLATVRPGIVISGSSDRNVIVHNMDTGECVNKWSGHEKEVTKVVYKHVGGKHYVLSGSRDTNIKLWRFNNPKAVMTYHGHEMSLSGLAIIDDLCFVSGGRDSTVRLWDFETNQPVRTQKINRNMVTHIDKVPQQNLFIQTSEDRTLRLWDVRTMSVVFQSQPRNQILTHCDSSANSNLCLTANGGSVNEGCEVTLWDLRAQDVVKEFRGHENTVKSAIFMPQQVTWKKLVISASSDHTVRVWNLDDGSMLWKETIPTNVELHACVGFADGNVVVAGDEAMLCGMRLYGKAGRPFLFCNSIQSNFHHPTMMPGATSSHSIG
ncbi:unnamed protein product [Bursaphelenchus okinawaensis]|uniref:WD_REPEATS_REGION domain-containing protein n=1 Tax=Bursaphelenchus okinawaensis TaxID=465554 RepID=A0A811K1N5_9BILA|nr:unnamed protein product [Bursaphelenchus okinawaensis]CAG9090110.1 unnamed protein product [Bursaphelenchus okinawaensis]